MLLYRSDQFYYLENNSKSNATARSNGNANCLGIVQHFVDHETFPFGSDETFADQQLNRVEISFGPMEHIAICRQKEKRDQNVNNLDDAHDPSDHRIAAHQNAELQNWLDRWIKSSLNLRVGGFS